MGIIIEFATDVDPNVVFAPQKWSKYAQGQVTVGQDSGTFATLGANVGSNSITLSTSQLPAHNHSFNLSTNSTGSHKHDRGTMNITATLECYMASHDGAFWNSEQTGGGAKGGEYFNVHKNYFSADQSWVGNTSSNGSHSHTISGTINNTGSGASINIIQSSKVVVKWKRDS